MKQLSTIKIKILANTIQLDKRQGQPMSTTKNSFDPWDEGYESSPSSMH